MLRARVALAGFAVVGALSMFGARAAWADKPVNLSLFTPISIAKESEGVSAFRFNLLYGKNTSVRGLDLGLVNHTTTGPSKGLAWGLVNMNQGSFLGAQLGTVNYNEGSTEGLQWGFVNHATNGRGLQLGFVNYAKRLNGLQIGLVNVISQGGVLPVLPIVNWSF